MMKEILVKVISIEITNFLFVRKEIFRLIGTKNKRSN